jgi:hypothetical protein
MRECLPPPLLERHARSLGRDRRGRSGRHFPVKPLCMNIRALDSKATHSRKHVEGEAEGTSDANPILPR